MDEVQAEAVLHTAEIGDHLDEARDLVGVVDSTAMAGGYGQDAEKNEAQHQRWRFWAMVGFMVAGIVGLYLYELSPASSDWEIGDVIRRLAILGLVLLPSG